MKPAIVQKACWANQTRRLAGAGRLIPKMHEIRKSPALKLHVEGMLVGAEQIRWSLLSASSNPVGARGQLLVRHQPARRQVKLVDVDTAI